MKNVENELRKGINKMLHIKNMAIKAKFYYRLWRHGLYGKAIHEMYIERRKIAFLSSPKLRSIVDDYITDTNKLIEKYRAYWINI